MSLALQNDIDDDAARDLEVSESLETSAYLTSMSLKDFSQMFEDAHRISGQKGDLYKEWSDDLIQLRVALASRFASCGDESPQQKLMRDMLIAESVTNICNVIGVK